MLDIFVNPVATTLVSMWQQIPSLANGLLEIDESIKYSMKPDKEFKTQYELQYIQKQNASSGGLIKISPDQIPDTILLNSIVESGLYNNYIKVGLITLSPNH